MLISGGEISVGILSAFASKDSTQVELIVLRANYSATDLFRSASFPKYWIL